jgi:ribonuclease HI
MNTVTIYTDGASSGNPGPGGYAAVIVQDRRQREISGGFRLTTNNRMELFAAIASLETLAASSKVRLFSDSQYLVESLRQGRVRAWQAKGWRKTRKERVPNADLWQRLLALLEKHQVTFEWIEGHAGDPLNERANQLAQRALLSPHLPADEGYEQASAGGEVVQSGLFDQAEEAHVGEMENIDASLAETDVPSRKVTRAGQPCRKCGAAVEQRAPSRKVKSGQRYYYEYYLQCPRCGTIYLVEAAKRGND